MLLRRALRDASTRTWAFQREGLAGIGAGSAAAALSVVGNIWRGDPHLVSAYPDMLSAAVVPATVWFAVRRWSTGGELLGASATAGRHMAAVAACVSATLQGGFTAYWLSSGVSVLVLIAAALTFTFTLVLGIAAAMAAGDVFEGHWDGEHLVLTNVRADTFVTDQSSGQRFHSRLVIRPGSPLIVESAFSGDGGKTWFPAVRSSGGWLGREARSADGAVTQAAVRCARHGRSSPARNALSMASCGR